ncbi:MAG: decaprenyl-phosphate phosphoribosyltransferase [Polyangiaceae bacterium]|nr:decaprenyl-phosphate phosphoribosyltransferase [Polyangiaceae bacterium]
MEHTASDSGACSPPPSEVPSSSAPESEAPGSAAPRSLAGAGWRLTGILKTVRPHQWVKNVFVLAPVVFAKEIFEPSLLKRAAGAFFVFCLLSGAVYTINDLADIKADRQHPLKRHRPIASGRVPRRVAQILAAVLLVVALSGAASGSRPFFIAACSYFVLNLAYSLKLKHIAYVDVGCIATFFVLRVLAGGFAAYISVSYYLLACTALLALFLGFGKRRHELTTSMGRGRRQRLALEGYSKRGLDVGLAVTASTTLLIYVAYTLDAHTREMFDNDWLWLSSVFVAAGILRFFHIVRHRPNAESPTQEMLSDGPFIATVLGWVGLVMWVVYKLSPG